MDFPQIFLIYFTNIWWWVYNSGPLLTWLPSTYGLRSGETITTSITCDLRWCDNKCTHEPCVPTPCSLTSKKSNSVPLLGSWSGRTSPLRVYCNVSSQTVLASRSVCLSASLSFSLYQSVCLSICQCACVFLSVSLFLYLPVCISACLSLSLFICLSLFVSAPLSRSH